MLMNTPPGQDAALSLETVLDLARTQRLSFADLFKVCESFNQAGKKAEAANLYKQWTAYNDSHPYLHMVYFNYAVTLRDIGDITGAIHAFRACLALEPKFGQAHINLGRALEDSGLAAQAIQQWRQFTEQTADATPDRLSLRLMAIQHAGRVMENADLLEEAETTLWQAVEMRPDKPDACHHWSALRQRQCKWPVLTPSEHITLRQMIDAMSALTLACYSDDPLFQLAKAHRYNRTLVGRPDTIRRLTKPVKQKTGTGQKVRVGYVSSDLRDHAVGFALREVFEQHDKASVEIYLYYCGEAVKIDETQMRMRAVADCWRDLAALTDEEAAVLIANDEIDILVDVNGYTKHARTKIFAYRPAPVIVNFCGYPGSMASPFHQYIIADEHVIPADHEIYYSEKVLHIPCTQPIDRKRTIAATPTRKEAGLPEDAFVFACFNGMQKTGESTFARWMTILKETPGSVLWLLGANEGVNQRLRTLAEKAGVAPERLIFAPKAANAHHLARIALADLFLDTFPYGAHSTAADALTMGLPVLTFAGKSFAARFCHSIAIAAGTPGLVSSNPDDYVAKAIGFARDRKSLAAVREHLKTHREKSVLRDIPALARRIEELFWQMQGEAERGETPVPDLRNLDVYYEIGAELVQQHIEYADNATYRQRYLDRLKALHDFAPIAFDNRLWTAEAAAAK